MNKIESVILTIGVAAMLLWAIYFVSNNMLTGGMITGGLALLGLAHLEVCKGESEKSQNHEQSKRN